MDLRALADFNLVAAQGGLGRASRASGQSKATLSRRIAELEAALGVRLVERGARSLKLTGHGEALHARTAGPLREIQQAGDTLGSTEDHPRGKLRVSVPVVIGHVVLGRVAAAFLRAYPDVRLEIVAEDRFVDLVEDGYDVVIRINPPPDEGLVGRRILHDDYLLVGPSAAARPRPGAPFPAVMRTNAPPSDAWRVRMDGEVVTLSPEPVLRLSSLLMIRDAVLAGAGAALLPRSVVGGAASAGALACWGVADAEPVAIWALHLSRRLVNNAVTAFIGCLAAAFPEGRLDKSALSNSTAPGAFGAGQGSTSP